MIDQEINSRVDAYRGNPEALQQKYSVSKELIDLLALQKIKQEMDAGSRQMQLMMAQQGKKPPIKQQLEQEVVGRTKQEMQQQLAGTMQQEATEKQKALQQAVQSQEQGVAGLPANNMMPTKAMAAGGILDFSDEPAPDYEEGMASGGIVAFDKGGNVWDKKKTPYDELVVQEARRRGIDPVVLKRLIGSESSFNPQAVSPRGEKYGIGIAQIADVHNMSKEDRLNPNKAIPAAAELFAQYLKRADGDYEKALQMYKGASSEGGKQRMAGPIRRILEGVASVVIPSAQAREPDFIRDPLQERGERGERGPSPTVRAVPPVIAGPTQPTPPKAVAGRDVSPFAPPLPPESMPYPEPGVANDQRKSLTYPQGMMGRETDPTANQPVTDEAIRAMAAPPAAPAPEAPSTPEATVPAGLASIIPSEYKNLATAQNKVLMEQLGRDPAEERRAREIEYYQKVGVPTEQALAKKTERQAGLEALDAERAKYDRENALTEALVNAKGSSWQGSLGSFGRGAIGVERRNADLRRQFMDESNKAQDALSDIGLGVKKDVNTAGLAGLKEAEDARQKGSLEAGQNIRQGMASQASRETAMEQAKQTALWHRAQLDVQNARTEAQKEARLQQYKNDAIALLKYDEAALNKLQETMNLALMQNQQPPEALKREFDARKKELQLKMQQINDRFMSQSSGGFQVERIK
jgi:hypothetical protein